MTIKTLLKIIGVGAFLVGCWYFIDPSAQQMNDITFKSVQHETVLNTQDLVPHPNTQERVELEKQLGSHEFLAFKEMGKSTWVLFLPFLFIAPCAGIVTWLFQKMRTGLKSKKHSPTNP